MSGRPVRRDYPRHYEGQKAYWRALDRWRRRHPEDETAPGAWLPSTETDKQTVTAPRHQGGPERPSESITRDRREEPVMSRIALTITGYATADAELRYTPSGTPVASVTIPHTPRRQNPATGQWEDAGETTWVRVSAWGDDAEPFAETVRRGTLTTVTGTPTVRAYPRRDGTPGASLEVKAREWSVTPRRPRAQAPTTPPAPTSAGGQTDPWDTPAGAEPPF